MSNRFNRNAHSRGGGGGQRGYFAGHHNQLQQGDNRTANYYAAAGSGGGSHWQRNPQRGGAYQKGRGPYHTQKSKSQQGHIIRKEEPHDDIIELPDEVVEEKSRPAVQSPVVSPQLKPLMVNKKIPDETLSELKEETVVANSSTEPAPSSKPEPASVEVLNRSVAVAAHSNTQPTKPVIQSEPVSSTAQESTVQAPGTGGVGVNPYQRNNPGPPGQYLFNLGTANTGSGQDEQWGEQGRSAYIYNPKPANAPSRPQQGYSQHGPPRNEGNSSSYRKNIDYENSSLKDGSMAARDGNQRGPARSRKRKPDSYSDNNQQQQQQQQQLYGGQNTPAGYDTAYDNIDWNNLEELPKKVKKCSARCRLYVGNLPHDIDEDKLKAFFTSYGIVSETYLHKDKAFGFIRLDTRGNAEAAKQELDGSIQKGRVLRVRFAVNSSSLKIEHLPPYVSNELLEAAFSHFGPVERAVVVVDDRGKAQGYGIVDFERKSSASQALRRIGEGTFLLTASPKPITVSMLETKDEDDGLNEKTFNKSHRDFVREREHPPRFAHLGSFEFDLACKWKQHYDYERQRRELLEKELEQGRFNLENSLQDMIQQHQTDMLRQALLRKQKELEHIDEMRRRRDEDAQRRAEEMRLREDALKRQHEELMRKRDMFNPGQLGGGAGPSDNKQAYTNIPPPPLPPHMAEIGYGPPQPVRYSDDRQARGDDDAQKRMRRF